MSFLKAGVIAASLCLTASFAHAGASTPMQGWMSWNNTAKSAFASAQPRMAKTWAKTWTNAKATPFSREAMENKSGH